MKSSRNRLVSGSHIIAVISKNMTGAKAEELLAMMTHNATNARIGNNVTVASTEQLYLMHLPRDVLTYIPLLDVTNSPVGDLPADFWGHLWNTIVSVADFIWRGLVAVSSFMINLVKAVVEIGLKLFAAIVNATAQVVEQVVDAIVDAFMAFVQWAVEFILSVVSATLSPILDPVRNLATGYALGLASALESAVEDMDNYGSITAATYGKFSDAFASDFFWLALGVSAFVSLALLLIAGVVNIFGFLLGSAASCVVCVLSVTGLGLPEGTASEAENYVSEYSSEIVGHSGDLNQYVTEQWTLEVAGENGLSDNDEANLLWAISALIGWHAFLAGAAAAAIAGLDLTGAIGLTLGLCSLALGCGATVAQSAVLALFSVAISGVTLGVTAICLFKAQPLSAKICNLAGLGMGFVGAWFGHESWEKM